MVKHIVMWHVEENAAQGAGPVNATRVKRALEAMNGLIPGLIRLEVGIGFQSTDNSSEIVLYSEFDSRESLERYRDHPTHVAVVPIVRSVCTERRVVDYET
jgi:quinol monooxygenase YgiN